MLFHSIPAWDQFHGVWGYGHCILKDKDWERNVKTNSTLFRKLPSYCIFALTQVTFSGTSLSIAVSCPSPGILERIKSDYKYHQQMWTPPWRSIWEWDCAGTCRLHSLTMRVQKLMWLLWLRFMGKREEIAYLCSPTRHIMFQRTPLPLSHFFPSLNLFFDTQRRITTGARSVQDTGGRWLT